jgi:hypothetical protein
MKKLIEKHTIKKIIFFPKKLTTLLFLKIKHTFFNYYRTSIGSEVKTVLFFLPELGIPLYLDMLLTIASDIKSNGYSPLFFGCNGGLHNCIMIDRTYKESISIKKSIICASCSLNGMDIIDRKGFDYLPYTSLKKSLLSFEGNSINERLKYIYKGIPIGRLAYYDLSIKFKRDRARVHLNDKERFFYDSVISDGIKLVDFLESTELLKSACAVIAIDEYCHANIVREWARLNQVLSLRGGFSYHFNADPQFVTLSAEKTRAEEKSKRVKAWSSWKNIPLPPQMVKEIYSDLIFRMSGSGGHIFSTNYSGNLEKIIDAYKLRVELKTLVVFTSANDEIDALAELSNALGDVFDVKDAFESQLDWITHIIEYAKIHDVQLIIKMHPRLSSSHRDTGEAEDIHIYEKLSETAPDNVAFIWPKDNVSAYDILQLADLCLTSWGTMGLEAAKLGVPVISGITRITSATPKLALFSKAETVAQFDEMVSQSFNSVNIYDIIEAYRWHHLLHIAGSILVDGKRDLSLYQKDFDIGFHNVLEGTNIVEEKYKFLMGQATLLGDKAIEEEMLALLSSIDKLEDFFIKNDVINSSHSKLIARLEKIKQFSNKEKFESKPINC